MNDRARWIGTVLLIALLIYSKSGGGGVVPVPTPTPGARTVVILHESSRPTPWFGGMVVDLQRQGSTAQTYLANGKHSLWILDKDLPNKWQLSAQQLPALFILDATGKTLFTQAIPANYTADNVIERLREHGG